MDQAFQPTRPDLWALDENQPFNATMIEWTAKMIYGQMNPTHMKFANNAVDDRIKILKPLCHEPFTQMAMYLPNLRDCMQIPQQDRLAMFNTCIMNMPYSSLNAMRKECLLLYKAVMYTVRNSSNTTGHKLRNHDALCNLLSQSVEIFNNQTSLDKLSEDMALLCLSGPNVDVVAQMERNGRNVEAHPPPGPDNNLLLPFQLRNWNELVSFLAHAGLPEHADYLHPARVRTFTSN